MYYGYNNDSTPGSYGRGVQKLLSALSYVGILWIIGLIFGRYDSKVRYHINQGIILTIFEFIFRIILFILHAVIKIFLIMPFSMVPIISAAGSLINNILTYIYGAITAVYVIIGIVNAISGRERPLPIIGSSFSILH
ncbi:MAG TPA: hypothetical protein DIV41_05225 [Ruminococcaceae bacterium]|jgi:uncharacterized membrane protein|nr:hypothetical protein [Oscillospiraceae bacterium]